MTSSESERSKPVPPTNSMAPQKPQRPAGASGAAMEDLELVPAEAREVFLWETSSALGVMAKEFIQWSGGLAVDPANVEDICQRLSALRRDFAFYSMRDPEALSEEIESVLRRFLDGEDFQHAAPERIFLWCLENLRITMIRFADTGEVRIDNLEDLLDALNGLLHQQIGSISLEAEFDALEQEFVLWDYIAADADRVEVICQHLSALRRDFAFYGMKEPEQLSETMEVILRRFLQGEFFQSEFPERVFLYCLDGMRKAMTRFRETGEAHIDGLKDILEALQGLLRQQIGSILLESGFVNDTILDAALNVQKSIKEEKTLRLGEVLMSMGVVTQGQVDSVLREQDSNQRQGKEAVERFEKTCKPLQPGVAGHEVPVDAACVGRVIDLLDHLSRKLDGHGPGAGLLLSLQDVARELARPFLLSLPDFYGQMVPDLALRHGRQVDFICEGLWALPSQYNLVFLANSLRHLLSDVVIHGLETPEERKAAGKKQQGYLILLAVIQKDAIWLSVSDDGRGGDFHTLAELLTREGAVGRDQAEKMNEQDMLRTLLGAKDLAVWARRSAAQPQNGTGLLQVAAALQRVKGQIDLLSRPGQGTRCTLRIPRLL